ncbi:hypothetical protein JCM33374_g3977 [Metschnikowia sp. JCM 33374]|nr:hypothetical protein JCM33374_g3977 [Metschnikowia sp. JCM 33374]
MPSTSTLPEPETQASFSATDSASLPSSSRPTNGNSSTSRMSQLSLAYEQYKKEMQKLEAAALRGEAGSEILERMEELENLFTTLEGNGHAELSMYMKDSEALKKLAEIASTNAEHVRFGDLGGTLPLADFLKAARKYMNPDMEYENDEASLGNQAPQMNERFNSLDWKKLGRWFYSKGKVPVPSHFLYGPLATQRRRTGPRTRAVDDTVSTAAKTTAQKVAASDLQDDPEQSTSRMVRTLYGVLNKNDPDTRVNLYQFFVNPHSFGQSVENLFYTSFLIRDGKLKIDMGPDNIPYVEITDLEKEFGIQEEGSPLAHHISSFEFSVWKHLIKEYNITESYIPHRTTEEDNVSDISDVSEAEESSTDKEF